MTEKQFLEDIKLIKDEDKIDSALKAALLSARDKVGFEPYSSIDELIEKVGRERIKLYG